MSGSKQGKEYVLVMPSTNDLKVAPNTPVPPAPITVDPGDPIRVKQGAQERDEGTDLWH